MAETRQPVRRALKRMRQARWPKCCPQSNSPSQNRRVTARSAASPSCSSSTDASRPRAHPHNRHAAPREFRRSRPRRRQRPPRCRRQSRRRAWARLSRSSGAVSVGASEARKRPPPIRRSSARSDRRDAQGRDRPRNGRSHRGLEDDPICLFLDMPAFSPAAPRQPARCRRASTNCAMATAISRARPAWRITIASSAVSARCKCVTSASSTRAFAERSGLPAQRLDGNPQDSFQEIDRRRTPQRLIETLAKADTRRRRMADCSVDQFAAAEFQKAAMPDAMPRRPFENAGLHRDCDDHSRKTLRALFQSIWKTSDAPSSCRKASRASASRSYR